MTSKSSGQHADASLDPGEAPSMVLFDLSDRIATVTLNRPLARNALSSELMVELDRVITTADDDPGVDVMILTGSDPAFCAGLDLKELATTGRNMRQGMSLGAGVAADSSGSISSGERNGPLPRRSKPLIGAINGSASTGGLELALACDFRIASDRARFADAHARVGVQPGWGMTILLPRAVGLGRALQMSTTGSFIDATTALRWGLVNEVVDHDRLLPRCRQLATEIVANDQPTMRRIMRTFAEATDLDPSSAWRNERAVFERWTNDLDASSRSELTTRANAVLERTHAQGRDVPSPPT